MGCFPFCGKSNKKEKKNQERNSKDQIPSTSGDSIRTALQISSTFSHVMRFYGLIYMHLGLLDLLKINCNHAILELFWLFLCGLFLVFRSALISPKMVWQKFFSSSLMVKAWQYILVWLTRVGLNVHIEGWFCGFLLGFVWVCGVSTIWLSVLDGLQLLVLSYGVLLILNLAYVIASCSIYSAAICYESKFLNFSLGFGFPENGGKRKES